MSSRFAGRSWFFALLVLASAAPARAGERAQVNRHSGLFELPLSDLRKAAEKGDRAELARTAERLGPARLAEALSNADRRVVVAALDALPLVDSGILALHRVLPLLSSKDDGVRDRAARTAAILLGSCSVDRATEWEIPGETLREACQRLAAVASDDEEATATRLSAVQGVLDAGRICAAKLDATKLLRSRDSDVRRAGVLALPASPASYGALWAASKDEAGRVAAAAGARLCQLHATSNAEAPAFARWTLAEGAAPEDVLDMLPCLVASNTHADRQALSELQRTGPAAIREAVKKLDQKPSAP